MSQPQPIESLEPRRYASQTPYVTGNGTLVVTGTSRQETITVENDRAGRITAVVQFGRKVTAAARFNPSQVKRFQINAGGGNDQVTLKAANVRSAVVHGESGKDSIFAVGSGMHVYGDSEDDRITVEASPNAGVNNLYGGHGRDRLTAGLGKFVLDGGDGNDILFHAAWAPNFDTPVRNTSRSLLAEAVLNVFRSDAGKATLKGGAGNDLIYAASDDGVWGGRGRDHLLFDLRTPGVKKPQYDFDPDKLLTGRMKANEIEVTQVTVR